MSDKENKSDMSDKENRSDKSKKSKKSYIETLYGAGYRLRTESED